MFTTLLRYDTNFGDGPLDVLHFQQKLVGNIDVKSWNSRPRFIISPYSIMPPDKFTTAKRGALPVVIARNSTHSSRIGILTPYTKEGVESLHFHPYTILGKSAHSHRLISSTVKWQSCFLQCSRVKQQKIMVRISSP